MELSALVSVGALQPHHSTTPPLDGWTDGRMDGWTDDDPNQGERGEDGQGERKGEGCRTAWLAGWLGRCCFLLVVRSLLRHGRVSNEKPKSIVVTDNSIQYVSISFY